MYRANLWLRTATRVVVRLGEFHARGFPELQRQAKRLPWERFAAKGRPVRFRVTSKKSRLYHTDAVAERLTEAIVQAVGDTAVSTERGDEREESGGEQLFIVRIHRDVCTVSADSSGDLLHRRGYRQAVARAPLRETLAAAAVLASGWSTDSPLVDPFCGSGTIPIEAALIARRIAPGLRREFAFTGWPEHHAGVWQRLRAEAEAAVLPRAQAPIVGSDRDEGAVASARANAERAGVSADVEFQVRAVSAMEPPPGFGAVVTNPPYGQRVGDVATLRNLYAQLGSVLRQKCPGWTLAIFSADTVLERQLGVGLSEGFATSNGGIPVRLMTGTVTESPRARFLR